MTDDLIPETGETAKQLLTMEKPVSTPGLAAKAIACARDLAWVPGKTSQLFAERVKTLNERMQDNFGDVFNPALTHDEQLWLRENRDFLRSEAAALEEASGDLARTEHVRRGAGKVAPRVLVIAEDYLAAMQYRFDDRSFCEYLRAFQTTVVLRFSELWGVLPSLKLALLEGAVARISEDSNTKQPVAINVGDCVRSLHAMRETPWQEILESLIVFDQILRRDPAGAYPNMDAESRGMYRQQIVKLAEHSDHTEVEIAEMVLTLATESLRKKARDPRLVARRSHVGYYLLAEGRDQLYRRANVRLPLRDRFQAFLRRHPDEFYPLGVEALTLGMIVLLLWWVNFSSLWSTLIAVLLLIIPCSQSAVEIMNFLTTFLLDPQLLPKLDFSKGVPEDCATMVVVPTLLLNEKQVRETVQELEVRYVGNMSRNLHFALLTDLGDSAEQPREDDPLVDLCGSLVEELNRKYANRGTGTFAMFHRHRVYNRREGLWIGWERKRGKLLDFNKLILGSYDSFPFKVGDLSILPKIRYVLTLDSDTQLPRGSAQKLIGAMAHPLCQAIIDSEKNIVVQGYGILQPRVGISVQSTARSRLASIYSDWSGLDLYTQAVSDVYQDLYGEGSFVGKGLYEVRTLHTVLDGRFPRNQILSHDLIEGAYTRAGLATDVKVIDSYPSHYSAYARRKHRWMRGDWQNVEWLLSRVPDESGRWVPNPISLISRWKILDNLRRTMVEPVTVAVFLLVWKIFPGRPLYWTLALMGVLFAPTIVQFVVGFARALKAGNFGAMKAMFGSVATGAAGILLSFAFRVHDALLSTDAIWRTVYRRFVSKQRLLQWETAAEAEVGKKKRTPVDLYLLWTPAIVAAMGLALYYTRRPAFWVALPILLLWGFSSLIPIWLDRPPRVDKAPPSRKDELFVRRISLRTWRYFEEFSTEEHHYLIPDNVQEDPPQVAARVSPTNLGMLLNARQVACEMGYLTVPELVELTRRTLEAMKRLEIDRGHLYNWYDTRSLVPLEPRFVSSVDSGNLAASLVALNHGCLALLEKPLISRALIEGYNDHIRALADFRVISSWKATRAIRTRKNQSLVKRVASVIADPLLDDDAQEGSVGAPWFTRGLHTRREKLRAVVSEYMPWLLPEFEPVRRGLALEKSAINVPLRKLPAFLHELENELRSDTVHEGGSDEERELRNRLLAMVGAAQENTRRLIEELTAVAHEADRWFAEMDFAFLLDKRRKLLSIGWDASAGKLHSACYDLLASEARIAAFLGIAKGEIPQDVWLKLGRKHVATVDGPALVSWAGTMFEYLMPGIWMGTYRDSVLLCSMERAVAEQQAYADKKGVPWGVSESGYSDLSPEGAYGYRFFGIPDLAMQTSESERVVIAPYAAAMAINVDKDAVLRNLRVMVNRGWFGQCGFYESADYGPPEEQFRNPRLVKQWMAHHQGMILLSMANFLKGDVFQKWFHADVFVQATELLLQERMEIYKANRRKRRKKPAARTMLAPENTGSVESVRIADGDQAQKTRRA